MIVGQPASCDRPAYVHPALSTMNTVDALTALGFCLQSLSDTRVSSASSNEHDCGGLFPCDAIDHGNQYGDYEGLASFGGVSHSIWTDSRDNQMASMAVPPIC